MATAYGVRVYPSNEHMCRSANYPWENGNAQASQKSHSCVTQMLADVSLGPMLEKESWCSVEDSLNFKPVAKLHPNWWWMMELKSYWMLLCRHWKTLLFTGWTTQLTSGTKSSSLKSSQSFCKLCFRYSNLYQKAIRQHGNKTSRWVSD